MSSITIASTHSEDKHGPDPDAQDAESSSTPGVTSVDPELSREKGRRIVVAVLAALILTLIGLSLLWSRAPGSFDVVTRATAETGRAESELAPGAFTTAALIGVARTLLDKSGGYLRNDVTPPSILLDNVPSWERGVVIELRDTVRALRDDFSRAQTQSPEDTDLVKADAQFHFDDAHWMLPATEEEFAAGSQALSRYLERLHTSGPKRASFHVRADNLNFYLATVEKRLGSYAQQLAGNVIGWQTDNAVAAGEPGAEAFTPTPWLEVDNVFFEARGYAWALLHTLRGIERDFGQVLTSKGADVQLRRIIDKLEQTQATVWSPMILNNSGFGLLTNHSLVIASYISRANAAVIDLRQLISEG